MSRSRSNPWKLLSLFAMSLSCLTTTVRAQEENLSAEVKQIFRTRCLECHGDTRREADINILDLSTFVGAAGSVVPGNVDESVLYDYIASDDEDFRMPEAPRPPLSAKKLKSSANGSKPKPLLFLKMLPSLLKRVRIPRLPIPSAPNLS